MRPTPVTPPFPNSWLLHEILDPSKDLGQEVVLVPPVYSGDAGQIGIAVRPVQLLDALKAFPWTRGGLDGIRIPNGDDSLKATTLWRY